MDIREFICIELAHSALNQLLGGNWRFVEDLDERYPNERSPEALLADANDSSRTAAVEVTRLDWPASWRATRQAAISITDRLWNVLIHPCRTLPLDKSELSRLERWARAQTEWAGAQREDVFRIPRTGFVLWTGRTDGAARLGCRHGGFGCEDELVSTAESLAPPGHSFVLWEYDESDHCFFTQSGITEAAKRIVDACWDVVVQERQRVDVEWEEEIALFAPMDSGEQTRIDGGPLLTITPVEELATALESEVRRAVSAKRGKFLRRDGQRWASLHVLVLDVHSPLFEDPSTVAAIFASMEDANLAGVDLVLLVRGMSWDLVWKRA